MKITTKRLALREFAPSDWMALRDYQSDPRYLEFYPWKSPDEVDTLHFVSDYIDWAREAPRLRIQLAIILKEEDRFIGTIGLRAKPDQPRVARLVYELNPHDWGKGFAQEAAAAMLKYGFDELGLHRVWSDTIEQNNRATIVLERLGFRREGRLRENKWMNDYWYDSLAYAILADEWRAVVEKAKSNATAKPPLIAEVYDEYSAGDGG
jgi:RimJ/RimL family protein N-acetyltransferase